MTDAAPTNHYLLFANTNEFSNIDKVHYALQHKEMFSNNAINMTSGDEYACCGSGNASSSLNKSMSLEDALHRRWLLRSLTEIKRLMNSPDMNTFTSPSTNTGTTHNTHYTSPFPIFEPSSSLLSTTLQREQVWREEEEEPFSHEVPETEHHTAIITTKIDAVVNNNTYNNTRSSSSGNSSNNRPYVINQEIHNIEREKVNDRVDESQRSSKLQKERYENWPVEVLYQSYHVILTIDFGADCFRVAHNGEVFIDRIPNVVKGLISTIKSTQRTRQREVQKIRNWLLHNVTDEANNYALHSSYSHSTTSEYSSSNATASNYVSPTATTTNTTTTIGYANIEANENNQNNSVANNNSALMEQVMKQVWNPNIVLTILLVNVPLVEKCEPAPFKLNTNTCNETGMHLSSLKSASKQNTEHCKTDNDNNNNSDSGANTSKAQTSKQDASGHCPNFLKYTESRFSLLNSVFLQPKHEKTVETEKCDNSVNETSEDETIIKPTETLTEKMKEKLSELISQHKEMEEEMSVIPLLVRCNASNVDWKAFLETFRQILMYYENELRSAANKSKWPEQRFHCTLHHLVNLLPASPCGECQSVVMITNSDLAQCDYKVMKALQKEVCNKNCIVSIVSLNRRITLDSAVYDPLTQFLFNIGGFVINFDYWSTMSNEELNQRWCQSFDGYRCLSQQLFVHLTNHFPVVLDSKLASMVMPNTVRLHSLPCLRGINKEKLKMILASANKSNINKIELRVLLGYSNDTFSGQDTFFSEIRETQELQQEQRQHLHKQSHKRRTIFTFELYNADHGLVDFTYTESPESLLEVIASARICQGWSVVINHNTNATGANNSSCSSSTLIAKQTWRLTLVDCIEVMYEMNINLPVVYRRVIVTGSASALYLLWLAQQHYKHHHHHHSQEQWQKHNNYNSSNRGNEIESIINLFSAPEGLSDGKHAAFQELLMHYAEIEMEIVAEALAIELIKSRPEMLVNKSEFCNLLHSCSFADGFLPAWGAFAHISCFGLFLRSFSRSIHQSMTKQEIHNEKCNDELEQELKKSDDNFDIVTNEWEEICKSIEEVLQVHSFVCVCKNTACSRRKDDNIVHEKENGTRELQKMVFVCYGNNKNYNESISPVDNTEHKYSWHILELFPHLLEVESHYNIDRIDANSNYEEQCKTKDIHVNCVECRLCSIGASTFAHARTTNELMKILTEGTQNNVKCLQTEGIESCSSSYDTVNLLCNDMEANKKAMLLLACSKRPTFTSWLEEVSSSECSQGQNKIETNQIQIMLNDNCRNNKDNFAVERAFIHLHNSSPIVQLVMSPWEFLDALVQRWEITRNSSTSLNDAHIIFDIMLQRRLQIGFVILSTSRYSTSSSDSDDIVSEESSKGNVKGKEIKTKRVVLCKCVKLFDEVSAICVFDILEHTAINNNNSSSDTNCKNDQEECSVITVQRVLSPYSNMPNRAKLRTMLTRDVQEDADIAYTFETFNNLLQHSASPEQRRELSYEQLVERAMARNVKQRQIKSTYINVSKLLGAMIMIKGKLPQSVRSNLQLTTTERSRRRRRSSSSSSTIMSNNTDNDEGNSALKLVEHVQLAHSQVIPLEIPSSLSSENKKKLYIKLLELITSIGNTTECVPMSLLSVDVQKRLQLKQNLHIDGELGYVLVAMLCPAESNMLYLTLIDITPIAYYIVEHKQKSLSKYEEKHAETPLPTNNTTITSNSVNENVNSCENKNKSRNNFEDLLNSATSLNVMIAMMTKEEMVNSVMNKFYTGNTKKTPYSVYTQKETKVDCVIVTIVRTLIIEMHAAYSAQLLLHELLTSELINSTSDTSTNHENNHKTIDIVDINNEMYNSNTPACSVPNTVNNKKRYTQLEEFNQCATFMTTFDLPITVNYLWYLTNEIIKQNNELATLSPESPQEPLSFEDTLQLILQSVLLKESVSFVEQPELFIPHVALPITSYSSNNIGSINSGSTIVTSTSTSYYEPNRSNPFNNAVRTTTASSSSFTNTFRNNISSSSIVRNSYNNNNNNMQITPLVLGARAIYKLHRNAIDYPTLEKLQQYQLQHGKKRPIHDDCASFAITSIPSERNVACNLQCTSGKNINEICTESDELTLHLTFHSLSAYLITLFEMQRVYKERVHDCLNKMYNTLRKYINNNNMESELEQSLLRSKNSYSNTYNIDTINVTGSLEPSSGCGAFVNSTRLLSSAFRELYNFADVEQTRIGCAISSMCEQVRERIAMICMHYTLCSGEYINLWGTKEILEHEVPHSERVPEVKAVDEEECVKWPVNALSVLIHNENTQVYKTISTISHTSSSDNNTDNNSSCSASYLSKLQTLFTTIVLPALRENTKFNLGSVDIRFTQEESMYENINPITASMNIFRRCVDEDKMCVWSVEEGVYFFLPNEAWAHQIILCVELHIIRDMAVNKAMVYGCCLHDVMNDNSVNAKTNKFFAKQSTNFKIYDKLQTLYQQECQNDSAQMEVLANALRKHLCDKVLQVSQLHLLKQLRERQEASVDLIPSFWGDQFGLVGREEAELKGSNNLQAKIHYYDKLEKGKRHNQHNRYNNKNNKNNYEFNRRNNNNSSNKLYDSRKSNANSNNTTESVRKNYFTTTNTKKNTSVMSSINTVDNTSQFGRSKSKRKNYNNQNEQIQNTGHGIITMQFTNNSRKYKYSNINNENASSIQSNVTVNEQSLYFLRGQNVLCIPLYSKLQDQCRKVLRQIVTNASRLELICINNRRQCFVVSDEKEVDTFHYIRLVFVKNMPNEASLDAPSSQLLENTLCSILLVQLFTAISRASIEHILHKIREFCYVLAIEELQAHLNYVQNTLISFHDAVLLQNAHRSTYRIDLFYEKTRISAGVQHKNNDETKAVESLEELEEEEYHCEYENEESKCKLGEIAIALLFWHFRENKYKLFDVQDEQLAGSSQFNDFYKLNIKESGSKSSNSNSKNDESEKFQSTENITRTLYFIKFMDVVSDVLVSCKVRLMNNKYIVVESFTTHVPEERHCNEMYESSIESELAQLVKNVQVQIEVYKSFALFAHDRKTHVIRYPELPHFANSLMQTVSMYNVPLNLSNSGINHHVNSHTNNNLYTRHEQHMTNYAALINHVHGGGYHTINSAMLHTGNISTSEINPILLPYVIEDLCGVLDVFGASCFVDVDTTTTHYTSKCEHDYTDIHADNDNCKTDRVTHWLENLNEQRFCSIEHVRGFSWECIETMQNRIDADDTHFYITCNIPVCAMEKCNSTFANNETADKKMLNEEQEQELQNQNKIQQGEVTGNSPLEPEEFVHTPITRTLPYTLPNLEPGSASVFERNKLILSEHHFCTNTLNNNHNKSFSSVNVNSTPHATNNIEDVKTIKINEPQILLSVSLQHGISFLLFNVFDAELVISLIHHVVNDFITKSSLLSVIMSQRCGYDLVHPFTENDLALQCCGNVYDIVENKPISMYTDIYRRRVNHVRFPLKLKETQEKKLQELIIRNFRYQYTEHECTEPVTEKNSDVFIQQQKHENHEREEQESQGKEIPQVSNNKEQLSKEEYQYNKELLLIKKLPLLFKLLYRLYNQGLIVNYSFAAEDAIKALYDECPFLSLMECEDLVQEWLNEHTFELDPHSHLLPQRYLHRVLQRSYVNSNTLQESQNITLITPSALGSNSGISGVNKREKEQGERACELVAERRSLVHRTMLPVYKFVRHDWLQLPIDALVACQFHRHVMIAHILAEAQRTQHATEEALHTCDVMWSKVNSTRLAQDSETATDILANMNNDAAMNEDTNKFRQHENAKQQRQVLRRQETEKKKLQRKLQVLELTRAIVSLQSHSRQLFGFRIPDFVLLKPTWDAKDDILQPELPPRAQQQTIYAHPVDEALEFYMKYIQTQYPAMRLIDLNPDDVRMTRDSTLLERLHCRYGKVIAQTNKKVAKVNILPKLKIEETQTMNINERKKTNSNKENKHTSERENANTEVKRTEEEQKLQEQEEEEVILFSTHLWYGVIAFADVLRTPKMYNKYGRHLLPLLHRHASTLNNNNNNNSNRKNDHTYLEQNNEKLESEDELHLITTSLASSGVFIIEVGLQVTHYALDFFMVSGSCLPQSTMSSVAAEFQQSLHFDSILYDYTVSRLFNELTSIHVQLPGTQSTSDAIRHLYEHYPTAFRECSNIVTAFTLTDSRVMHLRAVKYNERNNNTETNTMVIIPEKSELSFLLVFLSQNAKNVNKSKDKDNNCSIRKRGQIIKNNSVLLTSNPNIVNKVVNKERMEVESKLENCVYYQYAGIVDWETSRLFVVLVPYNNETHDVKANNIAVQEDKHIEKRNKIIIDHNQLNNLAKEAEQRLLAQLLSSTLEERLANAIIKFTSSQLYFHGDKDGATNTEYFDNDSSDVDGNKMKDMNTLGEVTMRIKQYSQSKEQNSKEPLSNRNQIHHLTESKEMEVSLVELDLLRTHSRKVVLSLYNGIICNLPLALFTLCSQIHEGNVMNKIRGLLCPQHVLHVLLTKEDDVIVAEDGNTAHIPTKNESEKSNNNKTRNKNKYNSNNTSFFGDNAKRSLQERAKKAVDNMRVKSEQTLIITFALDNKWKQNDSNVLLCASWSHFVEQEEQQEEEEEPYQHQSVNKNDKSKSCNNASQTMELTHFEQNAQTYNELSQTPWMLMEIALYRIKNCKACESTNNVNGHVIDSINTSNKDMSNEKYELITHLTPSEKALVNAFSYFSLQAMYASVSSSRFN